MLTVQRPCLELTANRAGDVAARVAVTGGIVIPLWAAGSPQLNQKRVHEEEVYTYANPRGKVGGVQNIHNPSLEAHVLTRIHRQRDAGFVGLLQRMRVGALTPADVALLQSHAAQPSPNRRSSLRARNAEADAINETHISPVSERPEKPGGATPTTVWI